MPLHQRWSREICMNTPCAAQKHPPVFLATTLHGVENLLLSVSAWGLCEIRDRGKSGRTVVCLTNVTQPAEGSRKWARR